jgi:hypothetical protein
MQRGGCEVVGWYYELVVWCDGVTGVTVAPNRGGTRVGPQGQGLIIYYQPLHRGGAAFLQGLFCSWFCCGSVVLDLCGWWERVFLTWHFGR